MDRAIWLESGVDFRLAGFLALGRLGMGLTCHAGRHYGRGKVRLYHGLIFAVLMAASANAGPTAPTPAGACFEIVVSPQGAEPLAPILINRCTGATWLLV